MTSYEIYNENISAYETNRSSKKHRFIFQEFAISSFKFIKFECTDLNSDKKDMKKLAKIKAVKIFYDESSDLNKRAFLKSEAKSQSQQLQQFQSSFQFQTMTEERIKKKKQRCVKKKTKSQSLVEMFNDTLRRYNFSMFIREILQRNKINIT